MKLCNRCSVLVCGNNVVEKPFGSKNATRHPARLGFSHIFSFSRFTDTRLRLSGSNELSNQSETIIEVIIDRFYGTKHFPCCIIFLQNKKKTNKQN